MPFPGRGALLHACLTQLTIHPSRSSRNKTVAGLRRTKLRGLDKVDWSFTFAAAAYNLIRLPRLLASAA